MGTKSVEYGPVATRVLFENDDVRVWEMDLKPGEVCGLHHHTLDYVLYILEGAKVGVESPGHRSYSFVTEPRCTYFVPAGGIESAHNVDSAQRFHEALFELKRPRRAGSQGPGYAACEALAGRPPEPGTRNVLENDRVRVIEATVAPNESAKLTRGRHDAVVFVAEGGRVTLSHRDSTSAATTSDDLDLRDGDVRWLAKGAAHEVANRGTRQVRAVCVELK